MSETRRRPCSDIVDDVSKPRTWHLTVGLALFFGSVPMAAAQGTDVDPASLIGGSSTCPTPALVWQHVLPLVVSPTLVDRIRSLGGPAAPVQIVDLGPSFRVTVGSHVREYTEETRDCAKRAQFAAVFLAIAAGADPAASPVAPPQKPVETVRAAAPSAQPLPPAARIGVDLGATAALALGAGGAMIAPGLTLRFRLAGRHVVPVAAVAVFGPFDGNVDGVGIRQWQLMVDLNLRSAARAVGRSRFYVEVGAALEVLLDRPTDLALARTQVSYAVGPRVGGRWLLATRGRWSPFVLLQGVWFPRAPELFALPAGDLGRASPWNVGVTIGAAWGGPL
jgi:hypothetical protein